MNRLSNLLNQLSHFSKKKVVYIFIFFLSFAAMSYGIWRVYIVRSIVIEVSLPDRYGLPKPVPGVTAYIFESDALTQHANDQLKILKSIHSPEGNGISKSFAIIKYSETQIEILKRVHQKFQLIKGARTGYKGNVTVNNIQSGEYWIYAATHPNADSCGVWYQKIRVTYGKVKLDLNEGNALIAF